MDYNNIINEGVNEELRRWRITTGRRISQNG